MRITESQLRTVIKKIIREGLAPPQGTQSPLAPYDEYYITPDGDEMDWADVESDLENEMASLEIRPSRKPEVNLKKLKRVAKSLGYTNIPQMFLQTVAERLIDYAGGY